MADGELERYKEQHRQWYAEWVRRQYDGPGCRAKIVSRAKYEQIVRAVRGELRRAAENSKFRFWVRAKGFRMGAPTTGLRPVDDRDDSLYVVDTRNGTAAVGREWRQQRDLCYKKVAVVDEFFDIIYRVHCSGGDILARHSGQKRTHRTIMETYAFLPREAVTAFLMGCPQCSTTNSASSAAIENPLRPVGTTVVDQRCRSFACSTPVKRDVPDTGGMVPADVGPDKENVSEDDRRPTTAATTVATKAKIGNKRKRTVPLKRDVLRQPCRIIAATDAVAAATSSNTSNVGSGILKNSSSSSCAPAILSSSSSSSSRTTNYSGASRSSVGGWWSTTKWAVCKNSDVSGANVGRLSDSSGCIAGNVAQPLDLSSSPAVGHSSSPAEDFFYKRRRVRRRRSVRPKQLRSRSRFGLHNRHDDYDDTSANDDDDDDDDDISVRSGQRRFGANGKVEIGGIEENGETTNKRDGQVKGVKTSDDNDEDNGPRPAKIQRRLDEKTSDNNNDDDYYDKATAIKELPHQTMDDAVIVSTEQSMATASVCEIFINIDGGDLSNEWKEEIQEKSAALHSPMNKRMNGGNHHPYLHSRSIMNGLTTSSSPSSLSKSLDTITTSSAAHHNFHRHWLDMASDSVTNTNMMDVDGSADDNSMAAAAAAAAAALLFSPPSSVGTGISSGGSLSSLHPGSHLGHHHVLSPLAPLSLPPHSAASVGLTSAHHHHHIQQQLQQYAAAAVAAATAAAAAAAAASTAGDSTSPPPNLPLSLPPMAHHYNHTNNNNIIGGGGSSKRRSTGTMGMTVQQQLYRRSGTPTSSATSPRPLNSKNDADTTTNNANLNENGTFPAAPLPPATTTTVLWPPLGLLTAAHQQHHHSLSSPPKFQQLFGSSVNSLTAVTAGSQMLPSLPLPPPPPPPPSVSSPSPLPLLPPSSSSASLTSSSYRQSAKETNGTTVTTTNGNVTGNEIGSGTGNVIDTGEDDAAAMDDDEDEEDEEDEEEEEEEDLDDDEMEEGEEDGDEEEDGGKTVDGSRSQARRVKQVRRLRRLRRANETANDLNDGIDSGMSTGYRQQWQKPSTATTTANALSQHQQQQQQQQHQQSIGSSSQQHIDPERLKAFNMFVRLFVDENLDRQVPISRQPKDKVQAIIDSCGRQFPELSDRSRKRIRTYLKSCRRNKRNTPQSGGAASSSPPPPANPWPTNSSSSDSTVQPQRPTPAHLTSAQAETILAVACQRESDNARRMRLGLEPVAQPYPYSVAATSASNVFQPPAGTLLSNQNGNDATTLHMSSTSSDEDTGVGDSTFDKSSSNAIEADTEHHNGNDEIDNHGNCSQREGNISASGGITGDSTSANNAIIEDSNATNINCGTSVTSSNNNETTGPTDLSVNRSSVVTTTAITVGVTTIATTSPSSVGGYMGNTSFRGLSSMTSTTMVNHRRISSNNTSNASGMLQLFPTMATTSSISGSAPMLPVQPSLLNQTTPPAQPSSKLLNKADVVTVRQLIAGYRESAAFLLRSADELEHLLLLRG